MNTNEGFECKACGTRFASADELAQHGKQHAGMEADDHAGHEHFTCGACGTAFHSETELKEHARAHHA